MNGLDCIVIGSGHAGSCAALAAVEAGCKNVLVVDKCTPEWVGGNGYFTAGAHRTVHGGLQDLLPIIQERISEDELKRIDMSPYTKEDFISDIMRLGTDKPDAVLVDALASESRDAIGWLAEKARIPFIFSFHRQAYEVAGRLKFWGGMVLSVKDGGKGLIAAHQRALKDVGVQIWFNSPAIALCTENGTVTGVTVRQDGKEVTLRSAAVVLAAGGFEANPDMRRENLGEVWEQARVRGTPYNTGDGFTMAKAVGAKFAGDWVGCHSTCWDANAPANIGDRELTNQYTKSGYPLGIMVNCLGQRFVDEGEDFRNYTYAKFGRAILQQPGGYAFQIWDSQVIEHLRKEEYGDGVVEKLFADSTEELAEKLQEHGLQDRDAFIQTVIAFNEAAQAHRDEFPQLAWDPSAKDGLSTQAQRKRLDIPKSNWALPLSTMPLMAVKVSCGITFTFGGLAIDVETAGVIASNGEVIPGLFCTGEMVGGLFYDNYPGGSGLTAGAVFGRKAGKNAAELALQARSK